jgi:DNA-binding IclR family transcriptional regulator
MPEASAAIQALSQELGVQCLVAAAIKDDIVVVDRAIPAGTLVQVVTPLAPHTKLAPPAGMVYMSWVDQDRFIAWLRRHGVAERADQQRYLAAARVVRARGYAGGLENNQSQLLKLLKRLSVATDVESRQQVAGEITGILQHGVNFISSPVFAPDGSVPLALTIINPPDAIVGSKFDKMTGQLTKAAARVTRAMGGRQPAGIFRDDAAEDAGATRDGIA